MKDALFALLVILELIVLSPIVLLGVLWGLIKFQFKFGEDLYIKYGSKINSAQLKHINELEVKLEKKMQKLKK